MTEVASANLPILIVEDDLALGLTLTAQLEAAGVTVDHCQTSDVAIELLHKKHYGLIVLDIMLLDGPSGLYVIDAVRGMAESQRPPILMVTACNVDNLRNIDRCAVKAIMLKPLDLELFRAYAMATYGLTVAQLTRG